MTLTAPWSASAGTKAPLQRRGDQINDAYDKVVANDARFRYVIDNSTLPEPSA